MLHYKHHLHECQRCLWNVSVVFESVTMQMPLYKTMRSPKKRREIGKFMVTTELLVRSNRSPFQIFIFHDIFNPTDLHFHTVQTCQWIIYNTKFSQNARKWGFNLCLYFPLLCSSIHLIFPLAYLIHFDQTNKTKSMWFDLLCDYIQTKRSQGNICRE